MSITPKYDNDYVTLGYLNKTINGESEKTQKKIEIIPKNYNAPPVPPYYENSLLLLNGQIYKCIKSRLFGSFNISDWKLIVSTNELDEALKFIYDVNKLEYVDQPDGLIETFYQEEDPSLNWTTDIDKNNHVSDLWTTDTLICYQYEKKATNPVTYGWKKASVPVSLFDIVDGYRKIFTTEPTNYSKDDLWLGEVTKIATSSSETYNPSDWEDRDDFIESSQIKQEEYHKIYLLPKITEINRQTKSEIKKAIDEIILSVSQTYTTKTEVEKYIDDVKTEIVEEYTTKEEFNTQLALTSNQINAIVEKNTYQDTEIGVLNQEYARLNITSNQISQQVSSFSKDIEKLFKTTNNSNYIEVYDAFESQPVYFSFHGDMHYAWLGETTYLPFYLYDSYLRIDNVTSFERIKLPYFDLNYTDDLYDEFVVENTRAYIIRRLDDNKQPLENEIIEELGNILIPLKDGYNKLYMEDFELNYSLKYNVQNNFTERLAKKSELKLTEDRISAEVSQKADDKEIKGLLELTTNNFNVELNNKVGNNEIIAKINLSTEKDASGSTLLIQASKINIVGVLTAINNNTTTTINGNKIRSGSIESNNYVSNKTGMKINLDNGTIDSKNFKLLENGNVEITGKITATSGAIGGCTIENGVLKIATANIDSLSVSKISSGTNTNDLIFNGNVKCTNINATGGKISGFNINDTAIWCDSSGTSEWTAVGYKARIGKWLGSKDDLAFSIHDGTKVPFGVTYGGHLYAEDADIKGKITATSGTFTGELKSVNLTSGTININNYFSVNSSGGTQLSTAGGGFLSTRVSTHPYVSALNVSGYNGIYFTDGTNQNNVGSNKAYIKLQSDNDFELEASTNDIILAGYHVKLVAREGNVFATRSSGTNYKVATEGGNISSLKLKENIEKFKTNDYKQAYELLKNIDIYRYDYKYKINENKNNYGFIIDYVEQNKGYDKFLYFKDEKAKEVNGELDYLIKSDDKDVITFKKYDEETIIKYLMVVCKQLQNEIESMRNLINEK